MDRPLRSTAIDSHSIFSVLVITLASSFFALGPCDRIHSDQHLWLSQVSVVAAAAAAAMCGASTGSHSQLLAFRTHGVWSLWCRGKFQAIYYIHDTRRTLFEQRKRTWNVKNAFDAHGYLLFMLKNYILPIIIGSVFPGEISRPPLECECSDENTISGKAIIIS